MTLVLIPIIAAAQPSPALRVVVIEGEGAVNIIQQKTAVRPLVEVRDRNNVPVAGASVTFTIGGGGQSAVFAGGAQTLTVTTNAAGQAAASGLNAIGSGAFQIQVQAAYQGQIATAAISQTNFATAAAAAQAGAGAGGGGTGAAGGTAGGGAAGGGGMSATTIGIIGGAVAGGAVAATQLKGQDDSESDAPTTYQGPVNGQIVLTSVFTPTLGAPNVCTFTRTLTGTLAIDLRPNGTGGATADLTINEIAVGGGCTPDPVPRPLFITPDDAQVTGGPSAITFTRVHRGDLTTDTVRFNGSLSGNTINGTLTMEMVPTGSVNPRYSGSTSIPVSLTGPR